MWRAQLLILHSVRKASQGNDLVTNNEKGRGEHRWHILKIIQEICGSRVPGQVHLWRCATSFERLLPRRLYLVEERPESL